MRQIKQVMCPQDCGDSCSMLATVEDGRVIELDGDPANPFTQGIICEKMRHFLEQLYGANRLETPLIRKDGELVPCSWDEALDTICDRWRRDIAEFGPESIVSWTYSGPMGMFNRGGGDAFFNTLGATYINRTICAGARMHGLKATLGTRGINLPERFETGDVIVVWGMDPVCSRLAFSRQLVQARRDGARVILIDVYANNSARLADEVHCVTPGRDLQLALLLAAQMAERGGLRESGAIGGKAIEFENLPGLRSVLNHAYSLDICQSVQLCGLSQEEIAALADLFTQAPHTYLCPGYGLMRSERGSAAIQAIVALAATLTVCGIAGGLHTMGGGGALFGGGIPAELRVPNTARSFSMTHLSEVLTELTDPPIRSLYVYGSNPALIAPDQRRVLEGLRRPDLFVVVHDQFFTDTARLADVVLPATSFLECSDIHLRGGFSVVQYSKAVVEPYGESKSSCEVCGLLCKRFGFDQLARRYDVDYLAREVIASATYPFSDEQRAALLEGQPVAMRDNGTGVLNRTGTFSGADRIDFTALAQTLEQQPAADPCVIDWFGDGTGAAAGAAVGANERTFSLVTVITDYALNSTLMNANAASQRTAFVLVNPEDARDLELSNGGTVTLENRFAHARFEVEISERAPQGTIVAPGIFPLAQTLDGLGTNAFAPPIDTDGGSACCLTAHHVHARA